jgi:hypothetical protein
VCGAVIAIDEVVEGQWCDRKRSGGRALLRFHWPDRYELRPFAAAPALMHVLPDLAIIASAASGSRKNSTTFSVWALTTP